MGFAAPGFGEPQPPPPWAAESEVLVDPEGGQEYLDRGSTLFSFRHLRRIRPAKNLRNTSFTRQLLGFTFVPSENPKSYIYLIFYIYEVIDKVSKLVGNYF